MPRRAYQQRPKHPKRPKAKKTPKSARSFAGFIALVGSVAAVCVATLVQTRRTRKAGGKRDTRILEGVRQVPLMTTEHAACRMDCRHVTPSEVDELLHSGSINERKSNLDLLPCPKVVVDAAVGDHKKNIEAVISACPQASHLVTVIDLDRDWPNCYCP